MLHFITSHELRPDDPLAVMVDGDDGPVVVMNPHVTDSRARTDAVNALLARHARQSVVAG